MKRFEFNVTNFLFFKEEANRGKPNWEHLEDNLHILIQCEDTEKRARSKLEKAVGRVKKLLVPTVLLFFTFNNFVLFLEQWN